MREEQRKNEEIEFVGGAPANYVKKEKPSFWQRVWNFIKSLFY